jgi:ABC-type multidrug transport system fused ATPase/permease subunit
VILPRPGIYVFDEATNALDSESENLVRDAILGLSEDATLILIAHGSSVLGKSDVIYRLDSDGAHEVTLQEVGAA